MYSYKKYFLNRTVMENIKLCTQLAFFVAFIGYCSARIAFCENGIRLAELPKDILNDIIRIASNERIQAPECTNTHVTRKSINLWLWNRENPENPTNLNNASTEGVDPDKPIIILIPGWLCSINYNMPQLVRNYLEKYICNVIGVDWLTYSTESYANAYCSASEVANHVAEFICNNNLQTNDIHIVGHSIGGQIAGLIGQEVKTRCAGEITRITALDPAGPIYQFQPEAYRLDKDDAKSVDVIHTNQGVFGYLGTCGTTDFFPNCEEIQPGCPTVTGLKISDFVNLPLRALTCAHFRSAEYMSESILSNAFEARSTAKFPLFCVQSYVFYSSAIMGEGCAATTSHKTYLLWTNSQSPYAQVPK